MPIPTQQTQDLWPDSMSMWRQVETDRQKPLYSPKSIGLAEWAQRRINPFTTISAPVVVFNTISWPIKSQLLRTKCAFNLLSPHDALKHHFKSLKTDLIFLQLRVLEGKFPWNYLTNTWQFFQFFTHFKSSSSTASRELRQQFAACSGWRWQCKIRLERVKHQDLQMFCLKLNKYE